MPPEMEVFIQTTIGFCDDVKFVDDNYVWKNAGIPKEGQHSVEDNKQFIDKKERGEIIKAVLISKVKNNKY
jgi:hypothetical protein